MVRMTNQKTSEKDEKYVIDLCDKILGLISIRQHKNRPQHKRHDNDM